MSGPLHRAGSETRYRDEHEFEAAPGLPEPLPAGEQVLWRGTPDWRGLAVQVFHVRKVALYFALLLAWQLFEAWWTGKDAAALLGSALSVGLAAGLALALLSGIAWLSARATIYTITNKRVVMRIGVALPLTINVPFKVIGSAALHRSGGGRGDIALALAGRDAIGWAHLWPHARPWHVKSPQPMLRAIAQPERVAALLAEALVEEIGGTAQTPQAARPVSSDALPIAVAT